MDEAKAGVACSVCPRCGADFMCAMVSGESACWCAAYPAAFAVPAGGGCYCPRCLAELIEEKRAQMEKMHGRPLRGR